MPECAKRRLSCKHRLVALKVNLWHSIISRCYNKDVLSFLISVMKLITFFQLEESEEEVAEVMKKYKAVVSQLSVDQITLSEQSQQIAELEHSKQVCDNCAT